MLYWIWKINIAWKLHDKGNTNIMISNRMMFYSLVFCDDIVQTIWFVTSSLVHILQLNISARFVSGTFLEDNLLIAIILIYAGKAQLISNLHFHQACSINMRFIWWITKCIIKLLLYFFLPGIFIVKMYFSYILVCFVTPCSRLFRYHLTCYLLS